MKIKKLIAFLLITFLISMPGVRVMAAEHEDNIQEQTTEQTKSPEQSMDSKDAISEATTEPSEDEALKDDNLNADESKTQNEIETSINNESLPIEDMTVEKETTDKETTDKEASDKEASDKNIAATEPKANSNAKKETSDDTKKPAYTEAELRLLSALIYCEAQSEPYSGKLAVGIVVVNRKKSDSFPNTIKGVIYQKSQFGPAKNGTLAKALDKYDSGKFTSTSQKECIKAAKEALSGTIKVTHKDKTYNLKGYYYFNGRVKNYKLKIANHQFK